MYFLLFCYLILAEDGKSLWLRFESTLNASVSANFKSQTIDIAIKELQTQWRGAPIQLIISNSTNILALGSDGYHILSNGTISITASTEEGLLYGSYGLLRLQETSENIEFINISESPKYKLRILNHWDNLDRTVERGYAGISIWEWSELPKSISPSYQEYARANAFIGINGVVINNVNAPPEVLTSETLEKVKVVADQLRPYHIKVYLSINFASPMILGQLETADPLNNSVQEWWANKTKEIYSLIPDFGGYLVKANSEGLPGPQDFNRTHLDGANMLADALEPYNGIVMWRAFVYSPTDNDRANQAYQEFISFDGQFKSNVLIQVKNGPIDFQPREPFSPLFGAMQKTPLMIEFQITQEYLGNSIHLVFLATTFKECFDSDTYAKGAGSTVSKATDGSLFGFTLSGVAGVANIGSDTNWCGHHFAQANWYAFGRLAWNYNLTPDEIAREWLKLTFSKNEEFLTPITDVMVRSREAAVDYMMPLGLHHLFAYSHHYGPEPWCIIPGARPDWLPPYYHRADSIGIGFDRTSTGSKYVEQYFPPLSQYFNKLETCDERFLLWFHHVPWNYTMKSGRKLWDELCFHYERGVQAVLEFQNEWNKIEKFIDAERFAHVKARLSIQVQDAIWWKTSSLLYFQEFSLRPISSNFKVERDLKNS